MNIFIPICVPGKPRMTQRDKWAHRKCVDLYYQTGDDIKAFCQSRKFTLPNEFYVEFMIAMPKSWSTKKRVNMDKTIHQQKPDIDNLIKSLLDILRPGDDQLIWSVQAKKFWSTDPGMAIFY